MSDIEKYGLFAVLFVGGILLLIAIGGGFSDDATPAAVPAGGAPVVLDQPASLSPPGGQPRGLEVVRVPPLLPTDKAFTYEEQPISYPGERSSGAPALSIAPADPAPQPEPAQPVVLDKPAPAAQAAATYVVREGDTLADIAQKQLGSSKRWNELVKLNPGIDPKNLKIGKTIRLSDGAPAVEAPVAAAPAVGKIDASGSRTHTVAQGDTLGAIAKKYLGSITKADAIYQANRDLLKSPDALKPGQVLRIP